MKSKKKHEGADQNAPVGGLIRLTMFAIMSAFSPGISLFLATFFKSRVILYCSKFLSVQKLRKINRKR